MNDAANYIESLQGLMPWEMPSLNSDRLRYMWMRSSMISTRPLQQRWVLQYLMGMTRRSEGPSRPSQDTS